MEIQKVPEVMSPEALQIYIAMPSADNPNQTICLQDGISAITNAILDLQHEVTELKAQLEAARACLDAIAKGLHGEVMQARAMLAGIGPAKGVN